MSGVIGHVAYAVIGSKAAEARGLPLAGVIRRHSGSYLGGAYLGCDIHTLPSGICLDTGEEIGHGAKVPARSPLTGGAVAPWSFEHEGRAYTPKEIRATLYGRSHLLLGWSEAERSHALDWPSFLDFATAVTGDALELFGPSQRPLAWTLGWITHVVGDGLIKSVLPGLDLHLIDGAYTPRNRPVQDLVTYHEIGAATLGLDWATELDEIAVSPVEEVQRHLMRCVKPCGRLASAFPELWAPEREGLLRRVQVENHRYQRVRNPRLVEDYALRPTEGSASQSEGGEPTCAPHLSEAAGGLSYAEMRAAAEEARFSLALWRIGDFIADTFETLCERQPLLASLPRDEGPDWDELTRRWS